MPILNHKILKKVAVIAAAFFVSSAGIGVTSTVHAAKGDQGVDLSVYQGAYGKWGYNNDKFEVSQIGGTTTGWNVYSQWTYPSQVRSTIAAGKRAHSYIWWQNVTTYQQADNVLNYLLPRVQTPKGSIVALDVEAGYQNTYVIQHACDRIRQAGYTPMVYGYKNYLLNNTNLSYLAQHEQLWLTEYPNYAVTRYPNYNYFPSFQNVGMFQFTSTYVYGGLDGDVDLTGITDNGYKHGNSQKPVTAPPAVQQGKQLHQDTHTYTVRCGDSWWSIANAHHMSMYTLAQLNGKTIGTTIYPGQVLRVADSGQAQNVTRKVNQPVPAKQSNGGQWRDALGDTWHSEHGTFTLNTWVNLRWGARTTSSRITTLGPGATIKYDAWSYHNGMTWIRQPRGNGYAYMAVRQNGQAFGTFK